MDILTLTGGFAPAVFDPLLAVLPEIFATIIGVSAGWFWANWQAGTAWKKKEFKSKLILGLNSLSYAEKKKDDGSSTTETTLKLRTLFEEDLNAIYRNRAARDVIHRAIEQTKEGDPILRFPQEESWYILNTVLNRISEQFAEGHLKEEMGMEVQKKRFLFCFTYERAGTMRQLKPRIMIMEKDRFLQYPLDENAVFITESDKHTTRIETLRQLRKDYDNSPYLFAEIELSF